MNTSKTAVVMNSIIGKILSIIGYIIGIFFVLGFFITIFDNTSDKATGIIISLVFIALGTFLIMKGAKIKREIMRFKKYVHFVSIEQINSLEKIAVNTNQTIDFVKIDIQNMINKKYFTNAYINAITNEIVIIDKMQNVQQNIYRNAENVKCNGCGANNMKQRGIAKFCDYCGTTLK